MKNYLSTGEALTTGQFLASANGSCFAIMQSDGNFCLYQGSGPQDQHALIWCTFSMAHPIGDYFAIMQGDGNFCIYEGKPGAQRRCIWATYELAGGGRFSAVVENGLNFTVNQGEPGDSSLRPLWAARRLRIATYNTHLIEGSNVEAGAWIIRQKPVIFRDDERHGRIVQAIKQSGADIVALQEVWSAKRMEQIMGDLHDVYPYHDRGTNGPLTKAGSGIILVSKYPLENGEFHQYASTPEEGEEDAWACKGVLCDTVVLPDGKRLRIGMTHAWTNAGSRDKSCPNIADLIRWTDEKDKDAPTIFVGDFNIHRTTDPDKYRNLKQLMADHKAVDSWNAVHGDGDDARSATDDQIHNTLDQFFSPMRDTPDPDCIDFAFLRPGKDTPLRPLKAEVLRDWRYPLSGAPYWYFIHTGTTANSPTSARFGENLCVAVRTTEGRLMSAVFDHASSKWTHREISHDSHVEGSDGAPGLVWFDNRLHLFFQRGRQVYRMESGNGLDWSKPQNQGDELRSSGAVAAAVYRNVLHVFCRDPIGDGNQICYHTWGSRWSERKWTRIDTRHDISVATDGKFLCVVSVDPGGRTGGVMRALLDERGEWTSGQLHTGAVTTGSPGVAVHNGHFEVYYRDKDGGGIMFRTSKDGLHWDASEGFTGHATTDQVCPVSYGGKLWLFYPFVVNAGDHVCYPQRALAHAFHPAAVTLDMSDHYPYQVEIVWPSN